MVENLHHIGIEVSVVEMLPQIMPPLDPEMVEPVHDLMRSKGVKLHLGDGVAGFEQNQEGGLVVKTQSGKAHPADLVILVSRYAKVFTMHWIVEHFWPSINIHVRYITAPPLF